MSSVKCYRVNMEVDGVEILQTVKNTPPGLRDNRLMEVYDDVYLSKGGKISSKNQNRAPSHTWEKRY